MHPVVDRLANRARARVEASHWRERWEANHPAAKLPLPVIASWWPHVDRTAFGPLAWPAYRWPLNTIRWVVAHTWAGRWDGQSHPRIHRCARFVWTVLAGLTGLVALLLAALLTVLSVPLYLLANLAGAGLIVFGGWSSPRLSITNFDTSRLHEWAADVDDDLVESPVDRADPLASSPPDPWDFNRTNDPMMAAHREQLEVQRRATAELRRHNDLLQAPPEHLSTSTGMQTVRRTRGGAWRALGWLVLVASVVMGLGLFFGAWMLSIAASYDEDLEPPTFAEIQANIDADRPAGFETEVGE